MDKVGNYNQMSFAEIYRAANEEEANFQFPDDWDSERSRAHRFALDDTFVHEVDDAVSSSECHDGSGHLEVSISDIGSFAHLLPATAAYAERVQKTTYLQEIHAQTMLPSALSRDRLSLLHGQTRPAVTFHIPYNNIGRLGRLTRDLITRDVITTTALNPDEVELALMSSEVEFPTPLHQMRRVAQKVQNAEFKRGGRIDKIGTSKLITEVFMLATGLSVGPFFQEEQIPAIYRRFDAPPLITNWFKLGIRGQFKLFDFATSSYGIRPGRHLRLKPDGEECVFSPVSSPLRHIVHFANHANLASNLDGRPYLYDNQRLTAISDSYNQAEAEASAIRWLKSASISTNELAEKLRARKVQPYEFAELFFGSVLGTDRDTVAARRQSFEILLRESATGMKVIREAVLRGLIGFGETGSRQIITAQNGARVIDKHLLAQGAINTEIALDIIGQRAGHSLDLEQIRIMAEPVSDYPNDRDELRRLSYELQSNITESSVAGDAGVTHHIALRINGKLHTSSATSASPDLAKAMATQSFISEHGPVARKNIDPRIAALKLRRRIEQGIAQYPYNALQGYAAKKGLRVVYEYHDQCVSGQRAQFNCDVKVLDGEVVIESSDVTGFSKADAKLLAADELARKLGVKTKRKRR